MSRSLLSLKKILIKSSSSIVVNIFLNPTLKVFLFIQTYFGKFSSLQRTDRHFHKHKASQDFQERN